MEFKKELQTLAAGTLAAGTLAAKIFGFAQGAFALSEAPILESAPRTETATCYQSQPFYTSKVLKNVAPLVFSANNLSDYGDGTRINNTTGAVTYFSYDEELRQNYEVGTVYTRDGLITTNLQTSQMLYLLKKVKDGSVTAVFCNGSAVKNPLQFIGGKLLPTPQHPNWHKFDGKSFVYGGEAIPK